MQEIIKKNNAFFRQLIFLIILFGVGIIMFRQLSFFVGSFLGALAIYVVLRQSMFKLTEKYNWKRWLASLLLVAITAVFLCVLAYGSFRIIAAEIPSVNIANMSSQLQNLTDKLNTSVGFKIIPEDYLQKSEGIIANVLSSILNTTYSFTANILMMIIILYFMLAGGRKMEVHIWKYIPFDGKSLSLMKKEAKDMIYSNAVGIPVILVLQTITSGLIYWLLGFQDFFFWAFLTALCGLIPILGTMIVYVPMSIYMMVTGEVWQGMVLLAYGIVIISNTDNVFRIVLMKKVADTHPLVVIFGVMLGIPLFGFWGIIFGPLLISGFMLLTKIYYMEYGLMDHPTDEEMNRPPVKRVPKHVTRFAEKASARRQAKTTAAEKAPK